MAVGRAKEDGFLLRSAPEVPYPGWVPPPDLAGLDLERGLPAGLRDHLRGAAAPEAEHRLVAIAFLEFRGTDELLRARRGGGGRRRPGPVRAQRAKKVRSR